jgi:tagatose kinase
MTPKILTLGDLLVEVMRKELDQPLSHAADFVGPFPSGASAIFIDAAARLGGSTGYIGVAGLDDFGECVVGRLREDGVDTGHIRQAPGYTTGTAFVMYRSDGTRKFVYHLSQSAAAQLNPDDVDLDYVRGAAYVHITGSALAMNESVRQACYKAIKTVKEAGGRVSFDPNIRPELLGIDRVREIVEPVIQACDLLLPSWQPAAVSWRGVSRSWH